MVKILREQCRKNHAEKMRKYRESCAAIKIGVRLRARLARRGPPDQRVLSVGRHRVSCAAPLYVEAVRARAAATMLLFLTDEKKLYYSRIKCTNFCKRIRNIQRRWKRTRKFFEDIKAGLVEYMDRAVGILRETFLAQKKAIRTHKNSHK